ncbi:MAG: hypothetical protein BWX72_00873 [Firmicutes bacterium ADurb.Bin080]|jgi:hypothetical protein|nr:hypothetical protein [Clostridiales bacterium]OQC15730.1 MAG: hypothetical protein BWX72_00873 [Firmicutes bacterium ADurb.Bin080]
MSKKKRMMEEQRAREEAARRQEALRRPKQPTASWRKLNNRGPVPIAPPSDFIQLTPIVQPIPLVPYSTQLQPLATFEDDDQYDDIY